MHTEDIVGVTIILIVVLICLIIVVISTRSESRLRSDLRAMTVERDHLAVDNMRLRESEYRHSRQSLDRGVWKRQVELELAKQGKSVELKPATAARWVVKG